MTPDSTPGSRGAVVSAALSERKVAGSIPTIGGFHTVGPCNRRFTRRADRRLPPGCYGNLIVNVKRGQSRPKRACGVDPDRHDWATFTFTVIAEVRSCCTEMTKES